MPSGATRGTPAPGLRSRPAWRPSRSLIVGVPGLRSEAMGSTAAPSGPEGESWAGRAGARPPRLRRRLHLQPRPGPARPPPSSRRGCRRPPSRPTRSSCWSSTASAGTSSSGGATSPRRSRACRAARSARCCPPPPPPPSRPSPRAHRRASTASSATASPSTARCSTSCGGPPAGVTPARRPAGEDPVPPPLRRPAPPGHHPHRVRALGLHRRPPRRRPLPRLAGAVDAGHRGRPADRGRRAVRLRLLRRRRQGEPRVRPRRPLRRRARRRRSPRRRRPRRRAGRHGRGRHRRPRPGARRPRRHAAAPRGGRPRRASSPARPASAGCTPARAIGRACSRPPRTPTATGPGCAPATR